MATDNRYDFPPLVVAGAVVIFLLAVWAMSFSHSCSSDGCIGIIFPAGAAAILLVIQLLVVIPLQGVKRHRSGLPWWPTAAYWVAASIAAFAVPIAFVK